MAILENLFAKETSLQIWTSKISQYMVCTCKFVINSYRQCDNNTYIAIKVQYYMITGQMLTAARGKPDNACLYTSEYYTCMIKKFFYGTYYIQCGVL